MSQPLRVLLFSTLFPSSARPGHGIFVETRLRELLRHASGRIEAKVVAPVPWFPLSDPRFGHYATFARTPQREIRDDVEVLHPRYPLPPKIGMLVAPLALALAALPTALRLRREGFDFDLIDAHYLYPDGVAGALLAKWCRRPLTMTARGSDINLIARHAVPLRLMRWAASRAEACIGVSAALVDAMVSAGLRSPRMPVLRNGVDLSRFQPIDRAQARMALNLPAAGPLLLSVGNLVPLKGHDLCIDAVAALRRRGFPTAALCIVGSGPEHARLAQDARDRGVADAVQLVGAVAQRDLKTWYSAADLLLLASSREGWPNVLLESMACGTPVIATRVGGTPEIVDGHGVGQLVEQRDAESLTAAAKQLLDAPPGRAAVRRHAERFGWDPTSRAQEELFGAITGRLAHA